VVIPTGENPDSSTRALWQSYQQRLVYLSVEFRVTTLTVKWLEITLHRPDVLSIYESRYANSGTV
jgi:hypothetical protein